MPRFGQSHYDVSHRDFGYEPRGVARHVRSLTCGRLNKDRWRNILTQPMTQQKFGHATWRSSEWKRVCVNLWLSCGSEGFCFDLAIFCWGSCQTVAERVESSTSLPPLWHRVGKVACDEMKHGAHCVSWVVGCWSCFACPPCMSTAIVVRFVLGLCDCGAVELHFVLILFKSTLPTKSMRLGVILRTNCLGTRGSMSSIPPTCRADSLWTCTPWRGDTFTPRYPK